MSPAAFDVDQSSLELIGQNASDLSGRWPPALTSDISAEQFSRILLDNSKLNGFGGAQT